MVKLFSPEMKIEYTLKASYNFSERNASNFEMTMATQVEW